MLIYQGNSWPKEYRGKILMNNIHGQRINMDVPERKGSGFTVKHGQDFLNFNDRWSQALNLLSDQDGSVYVIDWYDKNQCHHNNVDGHDRSNGRIYKVIYKNQRGTQVDLQKAGNDELVALQAHENEWHARHARRILQERRADVREAALKLFAGARNTRERLRTLWTLHITGGLDAEQARKLLRHDDESVRAWTIQLLAEDRTVAANVIEAFSHMARTDKSPVVRLYLAAACQRLPVSERFEILGDWLPEPKIATITICH